MMTLVTCWLGLMIFFACSMSMEPDQGFFESLAYIGACHFALFFYLFPFIAFIGVVMWVL